MQSGGVSRPRRFVFPVRCLVQQLRLLLSAVGSTAASTARSGATTPGSTAAAARCWGAGSTMGCAGTRYVGCGMGCAAPRCCGTRCGMGCAGTRCCGVGRATGIMSTISRRATSAVVSPSSSAAKTMAAPAVAVAPAGPWAHAQEDAVIEIAGPVKAIRRACIGGIVVIAVGTDGWDTDVYDNLRVACWQQGQRRKHCCSAK